MLSKEQVLEIISYCDSNGVRRKDRLRELGLTEWNFYKSRRYYLRQERKSPEASGSFIQLGTEGTFVPATVTEMERQVNPARQTALKGEDLTIECQTSRGGILRISGKLNAELMSALVSSL